MGPQTNPGKPTNESELGQYKPSAGEMFKPGKNKPSTRGMSKPGKNKPSTGALQRSGKDKAKGGNGDQEGKHRSYAEVVGGWMKPKRRGKAN